MKNATKRLVYGFKVRVSAFTDIRGVIIIRAYGVHAKPQTAEKTTKTTRAFGGGFGENAWRGRYFRV